MNFVHISVPEYKFASKKAPEDSMICSCVYYPSTLLLIEGEHSPSKACGEDSNCMNRSLYVECDSHCPCRDSCQNRRIQNQEYVKYQVIETPGKGHGIIAKQDIEPGTFVIEYVGEVLNFKQYLSRSEKMNRENNSHLYFMTMSQDEIIDASKKGNNARFINHSCDPNCKTQKWLVDGKTRVGIFAKCFIAEGTELTFDYKFERHGGKRQICLCNTAKCKGFIGVQKSLDSSDEDDEIEVEQDAEDVQNTVPKTKKVTKKIRKEYMQDVMIPVRKLFKEKDSNSIHEILDVLGTITEESFHKDLFKGNALNVYKLVLAQHKEDNEMAFKILTLIGRLPIATKNSIMDAKIEFIVTELKNSTDTRVRNISVELLDRWGSLKSVYRIPKHSRVASAPKIDPEPKKIEESSWNNSPMSEKRRPQPLNREEFRNRENEKRFKESEETKEIILPDNQPLQNLIPQEDIQAAIDRARAAYEKTLKPLDNAQNSDMKSKVSEQVIRYMSRFKKQINPILFKKHARKLSYTICDAEKNRSSEFVMDEKKVRKIKEAVFKYMKSIGCSSPDRE